MSERAGLSDYILLSVEVVSSQGRSGSNFLVHWCLPRPLQRNWTIPRYIPHHPPWECHTCCPSPTQVPYRSTALGMGQTEWMGTGRNHHTCWRTNRLGIITSILNETKRKTTTLLESQRPQLGDQERPLQDPNSGRNNPQASRQYQVHKVGWNCIIPMHRSGWRDGLEPPTSWLSSP